MYIGVVLLCQAYFARLISFRVLITNLYLILKILQKLKALVLMMRLLMQNLRNRLEMKTGRIALVEPKVLMWVIRRILAQLQESEGAPHKLLTTGMLLVYCNQELLFVYSLILCFVFQSPAAKMPRLSSSGDDTAVG